MGRTSEKMRSFIIVIALAAFVTVTADELKDLSSADVATPAAKVESKVASNEESNLGESTGFGGALMTSGSFTMMAGQGVEEEEGELGESTGFGGALMTSGSFTMMAGQGVE